MYFIGVQDHSKELLIVDFNLNIMMRWKRFRLYLWHINHCGLFSARICLYVYIRYMWFVTPSVDNIF